VSVNPNFGFTDTTRYTTQTPSNWKANPLFRFS
jgi:hypothetical protein